MAMYSYSIKIILFFLYIIVTIVVWRKYRKTSASVNEHYSGVDTFLMGLLILLMMSTRYIYFEDVETNIDTSTWLSNVVSINYYPDKLWKWVVYTDSRPLTVLPLWATTWLGININYTVTEFIGLLFWCGSIFLTYITLRLFISPSLAILLCWTLCIFIGTTNNPDHVAYNSEHGGIFLIALATFLYIRAEKNQSITLFSTFLLGLILGSLLFVKFQNIPMGLTIAGFSLQLFTKLRKFKHVVYLILGGILPTFSVNLIFLYYGKIDDFWNNYFWNYFFYSYTTQFQPMPMSQRFNLIRIGKFLLRPKESRFYVFALLTVTSIFISTSFNKSTVSFNKTNRYYAVIMLIVTLYAIVQAGNDFVHYLLYLFIPLIYCVAAFSTEISDSVKKLAFGFLLITCCVQLLSNCIQNTSSYPNSVTNIPAYNKVVDVIKRNSSATNNIVIWGWVDSWYYYSNRACGYRMPHTHQLFLKSTLYPARIKNFIEDLEENKPTLFIDAVVPGWQPIEGMGKPHEFYPEVKVYIKKHYTLTKTIDNIRIYKRFWL